MRLRGEENVTTAIDLRGSQVVTQVAEATALTQAACRFLSCVLWQTGRDWSIPRRQLDDLFLFLPVSGSLIITGPTSRAALGPGQIAIVPPGVDHAVTYAAGTSSCRVLAVHAHIDTAWGAPWPFPADRLVAPLPGHRHWITMLQRLAGLTADHEALGSGLGRNVVRALIVEAVLAGHPIRSPTVDLDPRLAAVISKVLADVAAAPSITALARSQGLGALRLRQLFQAGLGCAPKVWIDRQRLKRAADELRNGSTVAVAARSAGFATVRQLQARFKAAYGCSPAAWRQETVAREI